jgi:hypothetical protein
VSRPRNRLCKDTQTPKKAKFRLIGIKFRAEPALVPAGDLRLVDWSGLVKIQDFIRIWDRG